MTKFDMAQYLEQIGFSLLRQKGHPIYSDGVSRIVLPSSGGELNWRLEKKIINDIKKALRLRDENRHVGIAVDMSEAIARTTDPKLMALKYIRDHVKPVQVIRRPGPQSTPLTPPPVAPAQPLLTATVAESLAVQAQTKESEEVKRSNLPKVPKKFDLETKKRLRNRLVELRQIGHGRKEIAEILTKDGFKTPQGKPIDLVFVSNQLQNVEFKKAVRSATRKAGRFQRANELKTQSLGAGQPPPVFPPLLTPEPTAEPPTPAPQPKPLPPLKPNSELIAHASLIMDSGDLFDPEEKLRMLEVIMRKIKK